MRVKRSDLKFSANIGLKEIGPDIASVVYVSVFCISVSTISIA